MPFKTRDLPSTSALSGRVTPASVPAAAGSARKRARIAGVRVFIGLVSSGEDAGESTRISRKMETDAQLVASALAGSQEAFRDLVLRFERPVYSLIVRMVNDPGTAEDLAQEVFVKAYRSLRTYDASRKLSSWLFKIAHNTTIDHLRRHAPDTVSLEAPHDEDGRGGLAAVLSDESVEDPAAAAERR